MKKQNDETVLEIPAAAQSRDDWRVDSSDGWYDYLDERIAKWQAKERETKQGG